MKYDLRTCAAFPKFSQEQLECTATFGECTLFHDGDVIYEEGDDDVPMYVVKSGEIEISESSSGERNIVTVHGPGEFTGDVDLLTARPVVVTATARGETRVFRVPAERLRRLLGEIPELSDMLLDAFQVRRQQLLASGFRGIRLIGVGRSRDTLQLREFFYRNHVPHTFFDIAEPDGAAQLAEVGMSVDEVPVIACHKHIVSRPSPMKVAECLGISRQIDETLYDLVIVGAGPAGLAASVYASSEGLSTLVLDGIGPGGQAGSSSRIENFMGFPSGVSGADLANRGYLQALKFGTHFTAPVRALSLDCDAGGEHRIKLCTGQTARARCVLIASGVSYRQLEREDFQRLEGQGVYYAATSVEARVCRNSTAVVVGGGNSAGQAAMYLAQQASGVKLVIRGGDLGKSMSQYLCTRIEHDDRIEVLKYTEVEGLDGEDSIRAVRLRNNQTGAVQTLDCGGLFLFIGARPHTDWLPPSIRLDEKGFVLTGSAVEGDPLWPLDRAPCDLETTCPGVMAAGDVRAGTTKRCGFAVGDGSLAVACVHRYLSGL